ncbi:MAG: gamma-glutamyltransferase, partial [Parvibaculaceae bacterium]|nr:gamma-glutamyltransferase [Parvibaculaceae bacterium]
QQRDGEGESASGAVSQVNTRAGQFMVTAANPHATDAGYDILAAGGSAVDAAIAIEAVLSLTEPQSSGLAGGAYMLHWQAEKNRLEAYDGRETTPMGATPALFYSDEGQMDFFTAFRTGRAVGVPGVVAMLAQAHEEHGALPWADLFKPALRLATDGFHVSPRLAKSLVAYRVSSERQTAMRDYFFTQNEDGTWAPLQAGHLLKNPAYARTLTLIAEKGARAFYAGTIADEIVDAVQNAPVYPGTLNLADMAAYKPIRREAICLPYRRFEVCGMPPSSSGGLTVLQTLGMLNESQMAELEAGSVEAIHLITEASKLAFADRNRYIGDPAVVPVPTEGMLNKFYLRQRSREIIPNHAAPKALPGKAGIQTGALGNWGSNVSKAQPSTSHFSIVDGDGNVVSMTASVEAPFGSRLMAGGMVLNNQLTDFSFAPSDENGPIANAVAPGKRPRSSMSPTIVFDENNDFYLAIGSPGGKRIITYVTQTLVGLLDWDLTMQEAINLPRHVQASDMSNLELEADTAVVEQADALRALGHKVTVKPITSGLHGIRVIEGTYEGGADPRREGTVREGVIQ